MIHAIRRPLQKQLRIVLRSAQSLSPEWPVELLWPFVQHAFFCAVVRAGRRFRHVGSLAYQARKLSGR